MKRRRRVLFLAMMMALNLCAGAGFAASSPAWSAADPVVGYMDIDNVGSAFHWNNALGWQPGGTYQAEYTYDTSVAKTGYDGSKYLKVSKNEDGTVGHRGDLRVKFYMEAVAGDFDFFVDNTSSSSNIAFKCNLNLQDKENSAIQAETPFLQVVGASIKLADNSTVAVTNGAWYRARFEIDPADMTVTAAVYQLKEDGTLGDLVKKTENPTALNTSNASGSLSDSWQIQRYTVELYGAPNVVCGFDNFVLYSKAVNTASFAVSAGGTVKVGENSITSASKGIASEVAVGTEETLSFGVIPEEGYEVDSVMVGGEDKTSLFTGTDAVSVGTLTGNTAITVSFVASGTVKPSVVGSPAWGKTAPVIDIIDFDTYTQTWSKAGAYSANYSYDAEAIKAAGDQSKYLQLTKTTGASGQRGDCRVTFSNGQGAAAGSLDFMIKEGSVNENYLAKILLNLTDGTTQKETAIAMIKSEQVIAGTVTQTISNGAWYRVYYDLNKTENTATVSVYSLDDAGHVNGQVVPAQTVSLVAGLEDGWYVNRYTMEMYAKEGSGVGFDNFVLYDRPVQFVAFDVGEGGVVSLGQDKTISAGGAGYQSEVVIASGTQLAFEVIPEDSYGIQTVKAGETNVTAFFEPNVLTSVGAVTQPMKVQVSFSNTDSRAPEIIPAATGVITSDTYYPVGQDTPVFSAVVYAAITLPSGYTYESMGAKLKNSAGVEIPLVTRGTAPVQDGSQFGIKVYGPALVPGETYSFIPYLVVNQDGASETLQGSEQPFTVTQQ